MIASSGGTDRDVVMRLKLVADSANSAEAKKAFDAVSDARRKVKTEADTAIQQEAAAQVKAATSTEQISERVARNRIKLLAQIQEAAERQRVADELASQKAAKAAERAEAAKIKLAEKVAAAEERARKAAHAEAERSLKAQEKVDEQVAANRIKLISRIQAAQQKAREEESAELQRSARDEAKLRKDTADASANAAVAQIQAQQNVAREAERAGRLRMAAEMKFKEAAFGAARGALDAVKGLALVGIASEDDLQKLTKLFATVEGGYMLVRGLADVWYKSAAAAEFYRRAVQAAAVEQAAFGAAQASGAVGSAGNAAAGAVGAAGVAGAGMSMTAMAGVAAAGLALVDMLRGMNDPTQSVIFSFVGLGKSTEELRTKLGQEAAAAEARTQQWQRVLADQQALQGQRDSQTAGMVGIRGRLSAVGALSAEQQRELAGEDYQAALGRQQSVEQWRAKFRGSTNEQMLAADKVEADAVREVLSATERMADAQQSIVEKRRESLQIAERELDVANRQIEAAQKRVDSESRSFEGRLAAFGRLSAAEQSALAQISEKAKAGKISEADARRLDQLGFGADVSRDVFADKARAAGAEGILGGLRERSALDEATAELAKAQQQRREAEQAAAKATGELTDAVDGLIPLMKMLEETLRRIPQIENRGKQNADIGTTGSSGIGLAERQRAQANGRN